jgi:hypothetical protein
MFDPDAAFYALSYATVTGVVLVVLVLDAFEGHKCRVVCKYLDLPLSAVTLLCQREHNLRR